MSANLNTPGAGTEPAGTGTGSAGSGIGSAGTGTEDATLNEMPLLPKERIWGFWQHSFVNVGLAIATWAFLQGATVAYYVGIKQAIASIVIGYGVSVVLVALAPVMPSAKYGLEQFLILRTIFGHHGARLVMITMSTLFAAAWTAVLSIMLGHGLVNIVNAVFSVQLSQTGGAVTAFALVATVGSWLVLSRGPVSVERVSSVVAPLLLVVLVVMVVAIFGRVSFTELTQIAPLEPDDDPVRSFMLAVELGIAGGFAWWPNMGNLARLTKTPRAAYWPNMIGIFGASVVAAAVGCMAALVLESGEPTDWLIPLCGTVIGTLALIVIGFANITAILSQGYGSMVALRSGGGRFFRKIPWAIMGLILFIPAGFLVFFPEAVYDNYGRFLSWGAIFVAPLTGIGIVDFFVLRKTKLPVREIYKPVETSAFRYWHGWNPVAFVALALGAWMYMLLLHPITYEPSPLFKYTTASLPACIVAGLAYWILTKLITQRTRHGSYNFQVPVDVPVGASAVVPAGTEPEAGKTAQPADRAVD